jgi:tryptophanyl-tRNA synthetase
VGDVEVKEKLNIAIQAFIKPIRERRKEFEKEDIKKILDEGTAYARIIAIKTLERTRKAMHLDYPSI